ncbi:LrgB family protein [Peribacillus cavernae]|uniref:LrgB family protein n=1 Tax=Peribacillus cavernae TaxID=1674310 RepID=A0A433HRL6_9BACI|nr:LrgB family protein [Peribacillus cavernae]MDQ0218802.1 putative murein hydrolase (TIGR00659 family) [Peribacillus cavernae]RUQ31011.1 LrgB family protein [Peribacillus cavernae]
MKTIFFIGITYLLYRLAKKIYKRWPLPFLHPLLISPLALILLIAAIHVPADQYLASTKWISHMLGVSTVAFAIPIYKHIHIVKKHLGNIIISITTGTLVAILSSFALSLSMRLNPELVISILPRSITTPIAIEVSKEIGGLPALTTVFVICTGIFGSIIGPYAIKWMSITSPIARGLALGMGAHGVGTNKAREYGEQEATFSTLGMIFAAGITVFWGNSLIPLMMKMVHTL